MNKRRQGRGRGNHPNSRRNLRSPWGPGESGNENGRPVGSYGGMRRLYMELEAAIRADTQEKPSAVPAPVKVTIVKEERVQMFGLPP